MQQDAMTQTTTVPNIGSTDGKKKNQTKFLRLRQFVSMPAQLASKVRSIFRFKKPQAPADADDGPNPLHIGTPSGFVHEWTEGGHGLRDENGRFHTKSSHEQPAAEQSAEQSAGLSTGLTTSGPTTSGPTTTGPTTTGLTTSGLTTSA